ncbi:MAG: hypothetical protein ABH808_03625 [Candidatus Kuenenbacteria bacterium]
MEKETILPQNNKRKEGKEEKRTIFFRTIKDLMENYYIDENKRITDEMYKDESKEGREKLLDYKKNKLRINWFGAILDNCYLAILELIDDSSLKEKLLEECEKLKKEINEITQEGTNRKLVEKVETFAKKIKMYL